MHILVVLHGDMFLLQDVWSSEPLKLVMSAQHRVVYGEHEGMGMGLAIGWTTSIQARNMIPRVVHDSDELLAVVLELTVFGGVLVISPHISPSHEYGGS